MERDEAQQPRRSHHSGKAASNDCTILTVCAFADLQINLLTHFDLPILPFRNFTELPDTLRSFAAGLTTGEAEETGRAGARLAPSLSLLPHSALGKPLSEHPAHVLSDITTGFQDLVAKVSTVEGRQEIEQYLDDEDAKNVISFWMDEYYPIPGRSKIFVPWLGAEVAELKDVTAVTTRISESSTAAAPMMRWFPSVSQPNQPPGLHVHRLLASL
ncbi:hypothetical protein P8C59_007212 [Phyllachora maydis]|uniref:Uncharacterized protein n=1 Tax=Phyllachora maydis TaxID=1825666 RepID=A0AAD9MDB2_9PEZI|nr:hypothetical protein P8C59_007212 [Phyllachora maydis]